MWITSVHNLTGFHLSETMFHSIKISSRVLSFFNGDGQRLVSFSRYCRNSISRSQTASLLSSTAIPIAFRMPATETMSPGVTFFAMSVKFSVIFSAKIISSSDTPGSWERCCGNGCDNRWYWILCNLSSKWLMSSSFNCNCRWSSRLRTSSSIEFRKFTSIPILERERKSSNFTCMLLGSGLVSRTVFIASSSSRSRLCSSSTYNKCM